MIFEFTDKIDSLFFETERSEEEVIAAAKRFKYTPECCGAHDACPIAAVKAHTPTTEEWSEILEDIALRLELVALMKLHDITEIIQPTSVQISEAVEIHIEELENA